MFISSVWKRNLFWYWCSKCIEERQRFVLSPSIRRKLIHQIELQERHSGWQRESVIFYLVYKTRFAGGLTMTEAGLSHRLGVVSNRIICWVESPDSTRQFVFTDYAQPLPVLQTATWAAFIRYVLVIPRYFASKSHAPCLMLHAQCVVHCALCKRKSRSKSGLSYVNQN